MSKQLESMESILRERNFYQMKLDDAEYDCYNRLPCSDKIILDRWDQNGKIPHGVFAE